MLAILVFQLIMEQLDRLHNLVVMEDVLPEVVVDMVSPPPTFPVRELEELQKELEPLEQQRQEIITHAQVRLAVFMFKFGSDGAERHP